MLRRKNIRSAIVITGLSVAALIISACGPTGVPQGDLDKVKQQLAAQEQKATALQQQLSAKDQEIANAQKAKEQEIANVKKEAEAAAAKGGNSVYSVAKNVPTRPAATPAPAGFVPPPAATPVPLPTARVVSLAFHVETTTSGKQESPFSVDSNQPCSQVSIYVRGQRAVWRVEVVDATAGKVLQTPDVKSAVVKIPGKPDVTLRYGLHSGGTTGGNAWFWVGTWDIPMDYPLGIVDFTVEVVTNDGKTGTWKQFQYFDPVRDGGREPRMQVVP